MFEIKGKYSTAKIMSDDFDQVAYSQIMELCNQEFTDGAKVRIMPDYHAGKGCVIGFTADLGNLVVPNLVGVDIGCGVLVVDLENVDIDLEKFDNIVHQYIPSGSSIHDGRIERFKDIENMNCYRSLKKTKNFERAIGTLGGGNHFIELDIDKNNHKYLVTHTGSRNLGLQVADYYQEVAIDLSIGKEEFFKEKDRIIKEYKEQGRRTEIKGILASMEKDFKSKPPKVPADLAYLYDSYRDKYIDDIAIVQEYSRLNRKTIANIILNKYFGKSIEDFNSFETMHNYIDVESNIIRKGAVSAKSNEQLIIPINMRDGSLICTGKGNDEYNQSAPHGAGRIYSRSEAKDKISLEEFEDSMGGIYTTCVKRSTIDESPMAYKSMEHILKNISDTVEVDNIIKPIYNFKAS